MFLFNQIDRRWKPRAAAASFPRMTRQNGLIPNFPKADCGLRVGICSDITLQYAAKAEEGKMDGFAVKAK